ncbi:uracil phosphoribosyltransferase [Aphanomyces invadans]|uniref:uracil phosphoribosyltransferase n=1 Tax=Aphanomyces invadans TaxID=157072 RepID=A0A024UKT0_9STRA|nr:uracil phosphoribosyltransferase [Aphanomyces invadans]ETW06238.1 uracil phosphoribosyltransferase [Aphanomyces invadans]|eukprot:XP_008864313.1 uracil phosphoribosyltransferase [Aphanomyces invadans]
MAESQLQKLKYGDELMEAAEQIARGKTGRPPAPVRVHFEETGKMKNASTTLLLCKFCHKEVAGRAISLEGHLKKCPNAPDEARPPKGPKKEKIPRSASEMAFGNTHTNGNGNSIIKGEHKHAMKKLCTVTTSMEGKYRNLLVPKLAAIQSLQLMLRDKRSTHLQFKHHADRLMRIMAEEALAVCAVEFATVWTPNGMEYSGMRPNNNLCAVSIQRSGDCLLEQVLQCDPSVSVGKLLIQRDETSPEKTPILFYSKLPPRLPTYDRVMLLDPMLATGGSAMMAIQLLRNAGVDESNIVLVNIVSCPVGLSYIFENFPSIKVLTSAIDPELNANKSVLPGLGSFGDRYYNTIN